MKYDIVKDKFAHMIARNIFLRKGFYFALNMLILRQKYVFKQIDSIYKDKCTSFDFYDAGGGFFQYSDYILNKFPRATVHSVDIKEDYVEDFGYYLEKINSSKRFSYCKADLQSYVPKKRFDLIIAIDIMEHIENDKEVFKNFRKSVNDKGHLIISTPSNYDEAAKFTEEHVRPGYSKKELISKVKEAGFIIEDFKYTYGFFGKKYWILTMKKPLQIINKYRAMMLFLPLYYFIIYPVIGLLMALDQNINNKVGNGIMLVARPNTKIGE